ncbi:hypothetical protein ATCVMN08101_349R [Acanthocystis turfacea Chlorella virus MN0810.1]|nr:hypothetical protein ATCVMN08101_349R [Acanthocystis turfacea Chlorella virus MN0810.1]
MAAHKIVEESPGPLSNRFKQLKAMIARNTKEEPVLEDVQETPVEDIEETEDISPEVERAPEEIPEETKPAEEEAEAEIPEETKPTEEEAEAEIPEEAEEAEPAKEEAEEEDVEVLEETEDTEEIAEESSDEDDIHETEMSDVDDDVSVDVQTSPEEVSFFEDVEPVAKDFSELTKENGIYTVKFAPIYIQTPVVVLEEYQRRSAILRLPQKFCDFVASVEKSVGEAAKENREKWFKAPLDDDDIAQGLKTFLSENTLKVKVDEDFALFDQTETCVDDIKTPVKVRCILKTSEISFGKSEFGTIFTLKQAQLVKTPKCKISKPKKATQVSYFE